MPALATITIDVLSRQSGIDIGTIHSYERMGLVPKPRRIAGNLLLYSIDVVSIAVFVQRALGLGFSPQAVRDDPKVIAAYLGADEEEAIAVMESGT